MWRKIQELGLQQWYIEQPENALLIKKFQALSFVPLARVVDVFEELVVSLDPHVDDLLTDFLAYFETTWIGIVEGGHRRRPRYAIVLWNVHDRVVDDLPRTNNSLEGWHRAFDQRLRITHPTICRLVIQLRKEQASSELLIEQIAAGIPLAHPKMMKHVNLRLKRIVRDIALYDNIVFLGAIAHNL